MRGYPDFNHRAFRRGAELLRGLDHEVFSSAEHDLSNGFDFTGTSGSPSDLAAAGFDLRRALGDDLEWICAQADAIVVLPDWKKSRGARAEVATALAIGLPVWELGPFLLYESASAHGVTWEQVIAP
jgi:hypothetical protein